METQSLILSGSNYPTIVANKENEMERKYRYPLSRNKGFRRSKVNRADKSSGKSS